MTYADHPLQTIWARGREYRIVRRDFVGVRVLHHEFEIWPPGGDSAFRRNFVEWPCVVRTGHGSDVDVRWAEYNFNDERSVAQPNLRIPREVLDACRRILLPEQADEYDRSAWEAECEAREAARQCANSALYPWYDCDADLA